MELLHITKATLQLEHSLIWLVMVGKNVRLCLLFKTLIEVILNQLFAKIICSTLGDFTVYTRLVLFLTELSEDN